MGSKEGIASSLATLSQDDTVIVQRQHILFIPMVLYHVNLKSVTEIIQMIFKYVEEVINTSKTKPKMIIINFPSNPTTQSVSIDFAKDYQNWKKI